MRRNTTETFRPTSAQFSSGWFGKDANSLAVYPIWANTTVGVEDFHPRHVARLRQAANDRAGERRFGIALRGEHDGDGGARIERHGRRR